MSEHTARFRRRGARLLTIALILAGLASSPGLATTLRRLNIEDLTEQAGRVVLGRVETVEAERRAVRGHAVVRVVFEVEQSMKGASAGRLVFRALATGTGAGPAVSGVPAFRPGEKLLLFLYPESPAGLTSTVGLGQGKFQLVEDKSGRQFAANGFGNSGLFDGLSPRATARLRSVAPTDRERPAGSDGAATGQLPDRERAIATEKLTAAVEALR